LLRKQQQTLGGLLYFAAPCTAVQLIYCCIWSYNLYRHFKLFCKQNVLFCILQRIIFIVVTLC